MNTTDTTTQAHRLSIIVPLYNEEANVAPLTARVHQALAGYPHPWELILVNDGSMDTTEVRIREAVQHYGNYVRLINLQRNFGQTAAMQAGIDAARGDVIATLDGDLQNDPYDIPRMVKRLMDENLDLVAGWRKARKDNVFMRTIPSRIANRLIGKITGVELHDYGCSLKVYRADIVKSVRLYGEMHRFIPAWVAANTSPSRIKEEIVQHHPRQYGHSKYGIGKTFRVILDLLAVYFFMRFRSRPGHFFGKIGLVVGLLGILPLIYLFYVKFFLGEDIGTRPLLLISILLIVMSVQFLTTGVLSEMLARTYYESSQVRSYIVRLDKGQTPGADNGWKYPG